MSDTGSAPIAEETIASQVQQFRATVDSVFQLTETCAPHCNTIGAAGLIIIDIVCRLPYLVPCSERIYGDKGARNKRTGPGGGTRRLHQNSQD